MALSSASLRTTDYKRDAERLATNVFNLWTIAGAPTQGAVADTARIAIANCPWIVTQHPEFQQLR